MKMMFLSKQTDDDHGADGDVHSSEDNSDVDLEEHSDNKMLCSEDVSIHAFQARWRPWIVHCHQQRAESA